MMRVSLLATSPDSLSSSRTDNVFLSVTIKPSNNLPGSFEYQTDSRTLLQMLRQETDLSGPALESFHRDLQISTKARLHGVKLSEETLQEIGYFID